jgi:hypothetical protein
VRRPCSRRHRRLVSATYRRVVRGEPSYPSATNCRARHPRGSDRRNARPARRSSPRTRSPPAAAARPRASRLPAHAPRPSARPSCDHTPQAPPLHAACPPGHTPQESRACARLGPRDLRRAALSHPTPPRDGPPLPPRAARGHRAAWQPVEPHADHPALRRPRPGPRLHADVSVARDSGSAPPGSAPGLPNRPAVARLSGHPARARPTARDPRMRLHVARRRSQTSSTPYQLELRSRRAASRPASAWGEGFPGSGQSTRRRSSRAAVRERCA